MKRKSLEVEETMIGCKAKGKRENSPGQVVETAEPKGHMWFRRGAYGVHQQLALSACWVTRCQAGVWKDSRVANEAVLQARRCQ